MFRSLFLVPVLYIVLAAPKPLAKPTGKVTSENREMESNAFPTVEVLDAATPWDLKAENEEAVAGATPWQLLHLSDEMLIRATPWGLLKKLKEGEIEEATTWQPVEEATPWGLRDIATPWDRVLLPNSEKVTQMHYNSYSELFTLMLS